MHFIGYDLGSSSIKVSLINIQDNNVEASISFPEKEMTIDSPKIGWAEQSPEKWWEYICSATKKILKNTGIAPSSIEGIGLAYQMHGLVIVDGNNEVLRPSIIWCDSRAVEIGEKAFKEIGAEKSIKLLLNSPGNFTASKLAWVKENEPEVFGRINKAMLPGDYIGFKMTGEVLTTSTGLSEGVFWNFETDEPANFLLDHFGINHQLLPSLTPVFGDQGRLTDDAAEQLGLKKGIPLLYRAGDQPNNALSLGVFEPGEMAASGGTSGVVYGVSDQLVKDESQRINSFVHVNHTSDQKRIGVLLCINATGITYRWIKDLISPKSSYDELELLAQQASPGSDGLTLLPFGNGGERMLNFKNSGARFIDLDLNRHSSKEMIRATLEGIAFSFVYGLELMLELGVPTHKIKVGSDNLFQSRIFSQTIANLTGASIEMFETTGAIGAAKAAAFAAGKYESLQKAFETNRLVNSFSPQPKDEILEASYQKWKRELNKSMNY